jgi:DNA-binding CsgD family transcriptional regulator
MDQDRIQRLTERERAYLRLVGAALSSKEIARQYGIEPGTVDKALKSAMAKLGTSSRRSAARLLAADEGPQSLAPQARGLAAPALGGMMGASGTDRDWAASPMAEEAVREEQAVFAAAFPYPAARMLPFPRHQGERNELPAATRLLWIGGIAIGIVLALAALIATSWGVVRMVGQAARTFS